MTLYVLQHGDAEPKKKNAERPLSEQGRRDIRLVAMHLHNANVHIARILHSGKLRAEQSARLIGETIPIEAAPAQVHGLNPNDDPAKLLSSLDPQAGDILIVSHMPFVSRLCSLLLTGSTETAFASVPGTLFCLENMGDKWQLAYMLRPDFL